MLETEVLCGLIKYLWVCKGTAKGDLIFDENLWIFTFFLFSFSSYFLLQPVVCWIVGGVFHTHSSGVANSHKQFVWIKGIAGLYYLNSFGFTHVSLKEEGRKSTILRASKATAQAAPTSVVQGRIKVAVTWWLVTSLESNYCTADASPSTQEEWFSLC